MDILLRCKHCGSDLEAEPLTKVANGRDARTRIGFTVEPCECVGDEESADAMPLRRLARRLAERIEDET